MNHSNSFADKFSKAWASPTPEALVALLHPEVTLLQPHLPPIHGREAALREFRKLFHWLPGTHGEVDRSCSDGDLVYIEWRLIFPIGKHGVALRAVDRFVLKDGLGYERRVFFDQMPLVLAVLKRPWHWPGFLKYRLS